MSANAFVITRFHSRDASYFGRYAGARAHRLRRLYFGEAVQLDELRSEIPPRGAPVLKIIKQLAGGRHESQALRCSDPAAVIDALDTEQAIAAAYDLFFVEEVVDIREAKALAKARQVRRFQ